MIGDGSIQQSTSKQTKQTSEGKEKTMHVYPLVFNTSSNVLSRRCMEAALMFVDFQREELQSCFVCHASTVK